MTPVKHRIQLDLHRIGTQVVVPCKMGDTIRRLYFYFTESGTPYDLVAGCEAQLRAKLPDGTVTNGSCSVGLDGVFFFTLPSQMTAKVGIVECEVILYGNLGEQITSPRFAVRVEDTVPLPDPS